MRTFRHEHVLSMLGISFDIYGQPLVILPYLGNGDLLSFLRTKSKVRYCLLFWHHYSVYLCCLLLIVSSDILIQICE